MTPSLIRVTQLYRRKEAYMSLRSGARYKKAGAQKSKSGPYKDNNLVKKYSQDNLTHLKGALKTTGGTRLHGLKKDEINLFKSLLDLPFKLQHGTNQFYPMLKTGALSSLKKIRRSSPTTPSLFSTGGNIKALGNDGFVFFRVYIEGHNTNQTRYGDTCIHLDAGALYDCGCVSLHDQLIPFTKRNKKALYERKRLLMTSARHNDGITLRYTYRKDPIAKYTGKKDTQKSLGKSITSHVEDVSFTREMFYGKDIPLGIALSVIHKLRQLNDSGYRAHFIKQFNAAKSDQNRLDLAAELLLKFYRIEGKYPVGLALEENNGKYFASSLAGSKRPQRAPLRVDNPDGDKRYSKELNTKKGFFLTAKYKEEFHQLGTITRSLCCAAVNSDDDKEKYDDHLARKAHIKKLLHYSPEKLAFLHDPDLRNYLDNEPDNFDRVADLDLATLQTLVESDFNHALTHDYEMDELLKTIKKNPDRYHWMCHDDLDTALLDAAPDVPAGLLEYADEIGHEFDFSYIYSLLNSVERQEFANNIGVDSEYLYDPTLRF